MKSPTLEWNGWRKICMVTTITHINPILKSSATWPLQVLSDNHMLSVWQVTDIWTQSVKDVTWQGLYGQVYSLENNCLHTMYVHVYIAWWCYILLVCYSSFLVLFKTSKTQLCTHIYTILKWTTTWHIKPQSIHTTDSTVSLQLLFIGVFNCVHGFTLQHWHDHNTTNSKEWSNELLQCTSILVTITLKGISAEYNDCGYKSGHAILG